MNDLDKIVANVEALGLGGVEVRQFCGITWKNPNDPNAHETDGNIAVGELTGDLGDGTLVTIPVCESCLELVSRNAI